MTKKYLHCDVVKKAFRSLAHEGRCGKVAKERTSGLMYFLTICKLLKSKSLDQISIGPDDPERILFRATYAELVQLDGIEEKQVSVEEFGKVVLDGRTPEERASSNFLTTSLKRAATEAVPSDYPKRPAPLLLLGVGESKWGTKIHPNWNKGITKFFCDLKSRTPFTDLAIFICRNEGISNPKDLLDFFHQALLSLLPKNVANYWFDKIQKEHRLAKSLKDNPQILVKTHDALVINPNRETWARTTASRNPKKENEMKNVINDQQAYIKYLEELLQQHGISFNKQNSVS